MNEFSLNNVLKYKKYKYIKTLQSIVKTYIPSKKVEKFFPSINLDGHSKINTKINLISERDIRYALDQEGASISLSSFSQKSQNQIQKKLLEARKDSTKRTMYPKYVVFSSKPEDIMHMSMRGIKSCMRWQSRHSKSLIGSVIDPYCSIIYLTDNLKTKNMLARAVVRYVHNSDNCSNEIFIEKIYFNKKFTEISDILNDYFYGDEFEIDETKVLKIFKDYIKSKTNLNISYKYDDCWNLDMLEYPLMKASRKYNCWSYSDAELWFREDI